MYVHEAMPQISDLHTSPNRSQVDFDVQNFKQKDRLQDKDLMRTNRE